ARGLAFGRSVGDEAALEQELVNDMRRTQNIVAVEVAVAAAADGIQTVRRANPIQRRVQTRRLRERYDRIGVAVQREDGGRALGDVGERRAGRRARRAGGG